MKRLFLVLSLFSLLLFPVFPAYAVTSNTEVEPIAGKTPIGVGDAQDVTVNQTTYWHFTNVLLGNDQSSSYMYCSKGRRCIAKTMMITLGYTWNLKPGDMIEVSIGVSTPDTQFSIANVNFGQVAREMYITQSRDASTFLPRPLRMVSFDVSGSSGTYILKTLWLNETEQHIGGFSNTPWNASIVFGSDVSTGSSNLLTVNNVNGSETVSIYGINANVLRPVNYEFTLDQNDYTGYLEGMADQIDKMNQNVLQQNGLLQQSNNLQQTTNNLLQESNDQQKEQYENEKKEEQEREEAGSEAAGELGSLFNFSVLNPFAGLLGMFNDGTGCFSIPVIGGMLGLENKEYCSWFPASVRNILTPVIGMAGTIVLFGFVVSWLGGGGLNGKVKVS